MTKKEQTIKEEKFLTFNDPSEESIYLNNIDYLFND